MTQKTKIIGEGEALPKFVNNTLIQVAETIQNKAVVSNEQVVKDIGN